MLEIGVHESSELYCLLALQHATGGEGNIHGLHEIYDFQASPNSVDVEEGDLGEGSSTGYESYDRECWSPNVPPKAPDIPLRPQLSQFGRPSSLRKLVHGMSFDEQKDGCYSILLPVANPSASNVSTKVNSFRVTSPSLRSSTPGNKYPSEIFKIHDPHVPRRRVDKPSTERKGRLSRICGNIASILDEMFVEVYRHLLFRIPSMYHLRVTQLLDDAEVSRPDLELLIHNCSQGDLYAEDWSPSSATPKLKRFKHDWEVFVDQVTQEWTTLNVVSALLLS